MLLVAQSRIPRISEVPVREMLVGVLVSAVWGAPVTARAQDTARVGGDSAAAGAAPAAARYRDPLVAGQLATILPGAGHVYAGEYFRGYRAWVGTVAGLAMGPVVYNFDNCTFSFLSAEPCDAGTRWPWRVIGVATSVLGVWTWVSSARDAPRAAERANARRRSARLAPLLEPAGDPASAWRVGAAVRW